MKQAFLLLMLAIVTLAGTSQDVAVLMKEAQNFDRSLKDDQALEKYKMVLAGNADNMAALIRSVELNCAIGNRQTDKQAKRDYFEAAKSLANKAIITDSNSAEANYAKAMVAGKFTEIETENKKIIEQVKDVKRYADRALAINPDYAKANYVLGKWHFEMVNLNWAKRAAVKVFYGGFPEAKIETAFKYMEKCKTLDQYFVLNYLDLAKAYRYDNKPAKAIEVLNKLVKLPTRTSDDVTYKEEGKKILSEMQ